MIKDSKQKKGKRYRQNVNAFTKKKTKEEINQQNMEEEEYTFAVEYINGVRLINPN